MKKTLLFFILILFLTSCNQKVRPTIAFYYWKTIYKLSSSEKQTLKENHVRKLYLRYFDIDLETITNLPLPKSPIHFEEKANNYMIVPVIYIKNNVFLAKNVDIYDLAIKTNNYIQQINSKNQIFVQEIQIDCDWTLNSKDNYLKFIEIFKKISGKKLSATIRLHQIKYFETTKIPNVDNGVLMYYNMGKIAPDFLNSIYDRPIANRYLKSIKKYPLRLNIAFPIYSWAVHIRDHKVLGLKNKIDALDFKKDTNFVSINPRFFRVKNSNYKKGTFYQINDLLKIEKVSSADLLEMANDLKNNVPNNPKEIIFYDLDQFNTKQYEKDIFTKISNRF